MRINKFEHLRIAAMFKRIAKTETVEKWKFRIKRRAARKNLYYINIDSRAILVSQS